MAQHKDQPAPSAYRPLVGLRAALTCGATGIGHATALALADASAEIAILHIDEPGAEKTCGEIMACGPRHRRLKCVLEGARPKATVRGARGAAGPTEIRVRGTKYKPTCVPDATLELHARFMRRGSRDARWSN